MTRTNPVKHDMELACSVLACAAGARRGGRGGESEHEVPFGGVFGACHAALCCCMLYCIRSFLHLSLRIKS